MSSESVKLLQISFKPGYAKQEPGQEKPACSHGAAETCFNCGKRRPPAEAGPAAARRLSLKEGK